jgi:hypothetical protein
MFNVIADLLGIIPTWQRAIVFACITFLVVILIRKLFGKPLNSIPRIQYVSGFLLACWVFLYLGVCGLLRLDYYYQVITIQYGFSIRFFPLTEYLRWIPYLVPIGVLLPMTFPQGCRTMCSVLGLVFAGSLLVVLLQYKIDPADFHILLVVANIIWAAIGFKLYEYGKKMSAEKTIDGLQG